METIEFEKRWFYENGFYLTCDTSRMGKCIAHYELFNKAIKVPGAIVECGVFKGASLARFAMFRNLFDKESRKIVGFDIFGKFPETKNEGDAKLRESFIEDAGANSVTVDELNKILNSKNCSTNVELVAGDICKTVPEFVKRNPDFKIALLNLDTDIYEPAVTILEHLYPRLVSGGVLLLDDYGIWPGETQAVDDYFKGQNISIKGFPFSETPRYIVKP